MDKDRKILILGDEPLISGFFIPAPLEKRNEQTKASVKTTKANSKSKTQTN